MFTPKAPAVSVGMPAPDFTLSDQHGQAVSLLDFKNKKHVVLFFFPKAFTPGCTSQSCGFRDQYEVFQQAGAEVIGISGDKPEKLGEFASSHHLPFVLLSDAGGALAKRYGVSSFLGLLPGRVTFVINRNGIICHMFNSQLNPTAHITEAYQILKQQ